jgi:hypothetical protein
MVDSPLPIDVRGYLDRLTVIFGKATALPADDLQLLAHWAAYLCVLTSGLLEIALRSLLLVYTEHASSPATSRFVESRLARIQNPNMEVILQTLRSFDPDWAATVEALTDGEIADAVNSVIANRHLIAHGRSVGLTLGRMQSYLDHVKDLLEVLNATCNA